MAEGKTILDLGDTDDGQLAIALDAKGFDVTTCDISNNADIVCDVEKDFPKGEYDCVIASELIEHILETDKFLENVYNSLEDNGIFILSFPNIACLKNRIKLLFGKEPAFHASCLIDDCVHAGDLYHVRDFTLRLMKRYLEKHNFKIIEAKTNGVYVRYKTIIPHQLCPITFGNCIILKCKKMQAAQNRLQP